MSIESYLNEGHDGFYYQPDTGRLFKIQEIEVTRDTNDGKIRPKRARFLGVGRPCTHIIFFIMTGRWPQPGMLIDHKNNNPYDNSWNNLREATYEQNAHNRQPLGHGYAVPEEGLETCVQPAPFGRYRVKVKGRHIGTFFTKEEANACAVQTRQELYGEFDYNNNLEAK